jgi:hypothetical protein
VLILLETIFCRSLTLPSLSPSLCQSTVYTGIVWLGGGVLNPVGDDILQEFNTLYLTRLKTYKIATPPQTKPRRGVGLRQIITCCKVPLKVNFFR